MFCRQADDSLTERDYEEFNRLFLTWATQGENPYSLQEGGLGDLRALARLSFQWSQSTHSEIAASPHRQARSASGIDQDCFEARRASSRNRRSRETALRKILRPIWSWASRISLSRARAHLLQQNVRHGGSPIRKPLDESASARMYAGVSADFPERLRGFPERPGETPISPGRII